MQTHRNEKNPTLDFAGGMNVNANSAYSEYLSWSTRKARLARQEILNQAEQVPPYQRNWKGIEEMKLVWSPEKASKAYIDTVKSCESYQESSVAELISAMAAGWNAQLIVETWSKGSGTATSIGLAVAGHHAGGRHVCVVPDQESREEYGEAMQSAGVSPEIFVGAPEEVMEGLEGIDFLVVDCRRSEFARILRVAKLGHRGAVLICTNVYSRDASDFRWGSVLDGKSRIVRSVLLPVGKGLDIAHVGATGGCAGGKSRWIRHFDKESGEEFVIRR